MGNTKEERTARILWDRFYSKSLDILTEAAKQEVMDNLQRIAADIVAAIEETPKVELPLVDLNKMSLKDVAAAEGDLALERTLKRLKEEVTTPREAVSGFASAV